MGDCDDKPILCNDPLWRVAKRLPALRFAKPPANTVSELYERYPDGVECGSFARVCSEDRFYTYHVNGQYRGQWRPLCDGSTSTPGQFDISPSYLSVAYNDTSAKTIVVTAADDSWAATTGASWATVIKTGPNTAAINLTANNGVSQRSQDITFLWTDPDYGQPYTRTLTVIQAAKIEEPEEPDSLYAEGFVYDGATGLPMSGASVKIERVTASGTTTLTTVASGSDGKYRYTWAISEDDYDSISALRVTCSKDGYASLTETTSLPSYQSAVSNGIDLPNFTLAIGEAVSEIILSLKFVEEIAEDITFGISPSIANFEYNDTAARTIYVTAGDNTWTVAAGDPSWMAVTKNSDGTVSITPTQNSGDTNRTQQVTFSWTSPLGAVTTKTLYVTQYAQGVVTGQITISGKLIDSSTGAAIANITGNQRPNITAATQYGTILGYVDTDSSGNFSLTVEVDSDDYETWGQLQFYSVRMEETYQDKIVSITAPAFADAVANGISFGTISLAPLPTSTVLLKLKFIESDPINEGSVRIYGRTATSTPSSSAVITGGVQVAINYDGTPIATLTSDASGNFSYTWQTTEDLWNNIYMLRFTLSHGGYTGEDGKLGALLPTFGQAVTDGVDVGTMYLYKL